VKPACAEQSIARWKNLLPLGVLAGALLILLLQTFRQAYRPEGYDFTSYLLSAKALWQGGDPYRTDTPFTYIYPLFLAFLLMPLSASPYWLGNLVWFGLSVASLVFVCRALPKLAEPEGSLASGGRWLWTTVLVLAVLFSPVQNNLLNGQANLIVLFCCTMFLRSYTGEKKMASAAWLGAAIAIKLVPAILLIFLLVRGQFRILVWTVLFAAFFCLLPGIVTGRDIIGFYQHYWNWFLWPSALGNVPKNGMFFGLRGTIEYFVPAARTTAWTRIVAQSLSLLAIVAADMAGRRSPSRQRDAWAFAIYLLGCPLLSPTAEIHHLAFTLPAVCLLTARMQMDRPWTTKTVVALAACFVLLFDVAARIYVATPLFFVSLLILLILAWLANRFAHQGLDLRNQTQPATNTIAEPSIANEPGSGT
jgi:alpha-1,2-mannosyltransferase